MHWQGGRRGSSLAGGRWRSGTPPRPRGTHLRQGNSSPRAGPPCPLPRCPEPAGALRRVRRTGGPSHRAGPEPDGDVTAQRAYRTPLALRDGLEASLGAEAVSSHVDPNRLRRHVAFERLLLRLAADTCNGSPRWVLKGGLALELRLGLRARTTRDLDLALLTPADDGRQAHLCLVEALAEDAEGDFFTVAVQS